MPRHFRYALLACSLLSCAGMPTRAAVAATPGKSAKECNEELEKNAAALKAAGETAAAFIHACWWETKPGQPTPIASLASAGTTPPKTDIQHETVGQSAAPAAQPRVAHRQTPARPFVGRVRYEPAERIYRHRRPRPEPMFKTEEPVRMGATTPAPVPVGLLRPTTVVDVNLPVVGSVPVPILPGLEPAAHVLVENPAVPGLLTIRR